LERSLILVLN